MIGKKLLRVQTWRIQRQKPTIKLKHLGLFSFYSWNGVLFFSKKTKISVLSWLEARKMTPCSTISLYQSYVPTDDWKRRAYGYAFSSSFPSLEKYGFVLLSIRGSSFSFLSYYQAIRTLRWTESTLTKNVIGPSAFFNLRPVDHELIM